MKKFLILLFPVLFFSCATVKTSKDRLNRNGNYIDKSFTHSITVEKTSPLAEFGITSEEWQSYFNDSLLYKAYGKGNGYMSKADVKNFTCDAVKITTKNRRKKYAAIIGEQNSVNKSFMSQSTSNGFITTQNYTPIEKHDFSCYAVMFDNEDLIPLLREAFGAIQVITVQ